VDGRLLDRSEFSLAGSVVTLSPAVPTSASDQVLVTYRAGDTRQVLVALLDAMGNVVTRARRAPTDLHLGELEPAAAHPREGRGRRHH